jgi:hypothetical protein
MRQSLLHSGSALLVGIILASEAFAQFSVGPTSSIGGSSIGGSGSSGGSLFSGQRTTGGLAGSQSGGNSLFSGGAGALGTTSSQLQQAGTVQGGERFLNQNRSAQSFVGADINEIQNVGGINTQTQLGRNLQGALGNVQQIQAFRQQLNNLRNMNGAFGQNQQTQVRIGLSLGFTAPSAAAAPMVAAAGERLTRLPGITLVGTPEIALEGRTAVVRGIAASEQDRERVSRLLLLEPGISSVRYEMTVAQGTADRGSLPGSRPAAGPSEPPPAPPQF